MSCCTIRHVLQQHQDFGTERLERVTRTAQKITRHHDLKPPTNLYENTAVRKLRRSWLTQDIHPLHPPAIDGVMSLALCPQVVSQAPQRFRSSETQPPVEFQCLNKWICFYWKRLSSTPCDDSGIDEGGWFHIPRVRVQLLSTLSNWVSVRHAQHGHSTPLSLALTAVQAWLWYQHVSERYIRGGGTPGYKQNWFDIGEESLYPKTLYPRIFYREETSFAGNFCKFVTSEFFL